MIEPNKLCANAGKPDSMVEQYRGINVIAKDVASLQSGGVCENCTFNPIGCIDAKCDAYAREDGREVYFIEVKDYETNI